MTTSRWARLCGVFGLPSSISMFLSAPLAETVRNLLPKVKLRVVEAMSGFIRKWLQDETIDLGFLGVDADFHIWELVRLTLELAMITTLALLVVATPLSWGLARSKAAWKEIDGSVVQLPMVLLLPPDRAGTLRPGRLDRGPLGRPHARLHLLGPRHRVDCRFDAVRRATDPQLVSPRAADWLAGEKQKRDARTAPRRGMGPIIEVGALTRLLGGQGRDWPGNWAHSTASR